MIGLVAWCRAFQYVNGKLVESNGTPSRIAYPLFNSKNTLWDILAEEASDLSPYFDLVQLPPASLAQGGTGDGVDGYEAFEYRNFNGTHWGNKEQLMRAVAVLHAAGIKVFADFPFHQMGGENGGPGVFKYNGRRGETTPAWFQGGFGNHDPIPPFVSQDSIPDASANFPFGRPRSYENSTPHGVVEADTKDIISYSQRSLGLDGGRWDDVKATHVQSIARLIAAFLSLDWYSEYDDGNPANLNWWATSSPMNGMCAVEDYAHYWNVQRACNGYDATRIDMHGQPYWQWRPDLCVGFANNADVATTWGANGEISQQTAFNLLSAYVIGMCLPFKIFMVYAEDYFPASTEYPTGRGFKPYIDNLSWISRTFAFGAFQRRWVDKDIYCYTRDGNGGAVGWSGGLLVAVNFNTYVTREINVQTTWPEGTHIHDYTGHGPDLSVGPGGRVTIAIPNNAFSNGQGYVGYAPAGVNHEVAVHKRTTVQTFLGAKDLDISACVNNANNLVGNVFAKKGTSLDISVSGDKTGWQENSTIQVKVLGPDGVPINDVELTFGQDSAGSDGLVGKSGEHSIFIAGNLLPTGGSSFEVVVTYTGV